MTRSPPTRTRPASISVCTSLRVQPVSIATARSTRSPATESATTNSSCSPIGRFLTFLTSLADVGPDRPDREQHRADGDRGVGHVESGERAHPDEVDHAAAQETRRPEQPVDEIAEGAAENE